MSMGNHGEMMISTKKLPIRPKALYDYPTTELSGSKQEERTKGMMNLALKITFIHACN
jgi:hypothetical protein